MVYIDCEPTATDPTPTTTTTTRERAPTNFYAPETSDKSSGDIFTAAQSTSRSRKKRRKPNAPGTVFRTLPDACDQLAGSSSKVVFCCAAKGQQAQTKARQIFKTVASYPLEFGVVVVTDFAGYRALVELEIEFKFSGAAPLVVTSESMGDIYIWSHGDTAGASQPCDISWIRTWESSKVVRFDGAEHFASLELVLQSHFLPRGSYVCDLSPGAYAPSADTFPSLPFLAHYNGVHYYCVTDTVASLQYIIQDAKFITENAQTYFEDRPEGEGIMSVLALQRALCTARDSDPGKGYLLENWMHYYVPPSSARKDRRFFNKAVCVAPSKIRQVPGGPAPGEGLFACQHIREGSRVLDFPGRFIYKRFVPEGDSEYVFEVDETWKPFLKDDLVYKVEPCDANKINSCVVGKHIVARQNVTFLMKKPYSPKDEKKKSGSGFEGLVYVVALCDISPGEELIGHYGTAFW